MSTEKTGGIVPWIKYSWTGTHGFLTFVTQPIQYDFVHFTDDTREQLGLHHGRVYTINSDAPWAEAFIVCPSGTFIAVGTTREIQAKARHD
jgi:hypothetical protein